MSSFSRPKPSTSYKVSFNLYLSGHPTYLLSNDKEATDIFNKIKDIFKDSVNTISVSDVKDIYNPNKSFIDIEFNEFVKDAEIRDAIVADIKYLIEKITCSNHVHEKYNLQKHVINVGEIEICNFVNDKIICDSSKLCVITENFYLSNNQTVHIVSHYYSK